MPVNSLYNVHDSLYLTAEDQISIEFRRMIDGSPTILQSMTRSEIQSDIDFHMSRISIVAELFEIAVSRGVYERFVTVKNAIESVDYLNDSDLLECNVYLQIFSHRIARYILLGTPIMKDRPEDSVLCKFSIVD